TIQAMPTATAVLAANRSLAGATASRSEGPEPEDADAGRGVTGAILSRLPVSSSPCPCHRRPSSASPGSHVPDTIGHAGGADPKGLPLSGERCDNRGEQASARHLPAHPARPDPAGS